MTQRDQNQNTLLEDMFAATRRDAPEPSEIFMQGLLETIPNPNVEQAPSIAEERRSFLGVLKYAVSEMLKPQNLFANASAVTGVIAAGAFGIWIGANGMEFSGVSLNPFETQDIDIIDPFSGLDFSYVDMDA